VPVPVHVGGPAFDYPWPFYGAEFIAGSEPADVELSDAARDALNAVSTATLTVQLRKRGIANTFLGGLRPARPDMRMLGYAHTLRYVAMREDVPQPLNGGLNYQKATIESLAPDEVLVIEARNDPGSGTIGDILAMRALKRGATGIVTDGGVRDHDAVAAVGIPVYAAGPHPAVVGRRHVPWDVDVAVACGGTTVEPGDVLVGDADGVVVIPPDLVEEVVEAALAQEQEDGWVARQVADGHPVEGLFPMDATWRARFDAWRADR
jgi:regulator of RNase E activity RraA